MHQFFTGVLAQQFETSLLSVLCINLLQGLVAFFFLFALFVHHLATNQHEYCQTNQCDDSKFTAEMDNYEGYEETDGERCSGSDEPTADNAEYAGNTKNSRITSPGTVGKEVPIATMKVT